MKKILIGIFLIALFILVAPRETVADGMVIPQPSYYVQETDQKAVIWHDGKTETLIISITFRGDSDEFVWVIPTPSKPEVVQGVDELFTGLDVLARPVYTTRYGPVGEYGGGVNYLSKGAEVTVVETKKVDIYDIAVLTAENTQALQKWLEDNGYQYPKNREHLLSSYISKDWYFIAVKVNAQSLSISQGLKTGHATPLKISFNSEKVVYPLKISGPEASETGVKSKVVAGFSFEDGSTQGWYGGQVLEGNAYKGKRF